MEDAQNNKSQVDSQSNLERKLEHVKRSFADYLNGMINKLSASHKRISLMLFGLLMGIVCLAQIVTAINEKENVDSSTIQKIQIPDPSYENMDGKEGYDQILRLKQILDSLKETPVYDSLMIARPGLVDSVNVLLR